MVEIILIPNELSLKVERQYFEYNSALNVVGYLMQRGNINEELLQKYIDTVEYRGVQLELTKQAVSKEYVPEHFKNKKYSYLFDFDECSLHFEVIE